MAKTQEVSLRSVRILLVDDSGPIQRLMRHQLANEGVRVTMASDGRQAVAKALRCMREGRCFDLIFMDLDMPRMNGYQALQRLRERGYRGPVVALTAQTLAQDQQKCRQAGFDEYAQKPINKPNLRSIISRLVQKHRSATD